MTRHGRMDRVGASAMDYSPADADLVPHNRWDLLDVPGLGEWSPTEVVTVVIPYFQQPDELALTMAGLARQTYPSELLQVVVADDGSDVPLELPNDHLGLDVTVVRQERHGFGAPRARNLGASHARGDVLVFLDADMIPEAHLVEAHARWHHACKYAVTLGPRTHVDATGLAAADIAAPSDWPLADVFAGREQYTPEWIAGHLQRTDRLTRGDHDLFRVVASGNLGVSRALFELVGGFDESFDQWGGEDTELGYRLFVTGGLLVWDDDAHCWHQGEGHEPDASERVSLVEQSPKLAQLIAHHGFRRVRRGRSYLVPRVVATVRAGHADAGAALASIESLLASSITDIAVVVEPPADEQHRRWIERQFEHDPRVTFDAHDAPWAAPHRVRLDAPTVVGMETLDQIIGELTDPKDPIGVLYVTVPPDRPGERHLVAWNTRAVERVRFSAAGAPDIGTDPDDAMLVQVAELFGRRWRSGLDLSVGDADTLDPLADDVAATSVAVRGELQALGEVLARIEPSQQQRLVEVARTGLTALSPRQMRVVLSVGQRVLRLLGRRRR